MLPCRLQLIKTFRRLKPAIDWRHLSRFLRFVLARAQHDRLSMMAASLTFTTLLAIVPLLAIILSIIAAFPLFSGVMHAFQAFLVNNLVPGAADKVIFGYLAQFASNAARLTALGVVFLAVTSFMLMHTIERAFNIIWQVRRPRPIKQRLLLYWTAISLGPVLLGLSLSATSIVVHDAAAAIPLRVLWTLVSATVMSLAFMLLYLTVANRYVPIRHAAVSGTVAGIAFEVMKKAFAFYIEMFPSYRLVYGAFAAVPIFLIWIYLSWLIVLAGAVLTACLAQWRNDHWQAQRTPGWRFFQALLLLKILDDAARHGNTVGPLRLQRAMRLGFEEMDDLMHRLQAMHLVAPSRQDWVLIRRLDTVRLDDLYRRLAFDAAHPGLPSDVPEKWLLALAQQLDAQQPVLFEQTVGHLFAAVRAGQL